MNKKTFRLFISSTFEDLRAERDILQKRVFPKLRKYCNEKGFNFLPIDLRWGISQEAVYDQKNMKICIEEIKRSKQTLNPHFVVILGNRYGWIPLPYEIDIDEFQQIHKAFIKRYSVFSKQVEYLNKWYKKDENFISPKYILQPRITEEEQNWNYWNEVEEILRKAFKEVVENDVNIKCKDKYFKSATEQEVIEGVFNNKHKNKIFFFHRNFTNIEELCKNNIKFCNTYKNNLKRFIPLKDDSCEIDNDTFNLQTKLVKSIKQELNKYDNVKTYELNISNDKEIEKSITDIYLDKFATDFEEMVKNAIDSEIEKVSSNINDLYKIELDLQEQFLEEKTEIFVGREESLSQINDYIHSESNIPLVITATSGGGKSSLIAKAISQISNSLKVYYRFIGISDLSSTPIKLYNSLINEFKEDDKLNKLIIDYIETLNDDEKNIVFSDLIELQKLFKFILENSRIVLFLDALDQFEIEDPLLFLSNNLQSKVIISTLPNTLYKNISYSMLLEQKYLNNLNKIMLERLSLSEIEIYIDSFFKKYNKKLIIEQKNKILTTYNSLNELEATPLYLKIMLEEALQWHSYDDVLEIKYPTEINELIQRLFIELNQKHHHSIELVKYAFNIIACSRDGIPESEIFDILSLEEKVMKNVSNEFYPEPNRLPTSVWARLYSQMSKYLVIKTIDDMEQIKFFHRKFNESAYKLIGKETIHQYLANYYERVFNHYKKQEDEKFNQKNIQTSFKSVLVELPYQLIMSNQKEKILKLLTNFEFLMEKFKINKVDEILEDYELAKKKFEDLIEYEIFFIYDRFINSNKYILKRGNNEWDASKIFFQLSIEHADNSPLTIAAEKYESEGKVNWDYFRDMDRPIKIKPLKMFIIQPNIKGFTQLKNGDILTYGQSIRIWDKYFNFKNEIFIKNKYKMNVMIDKVYEKNGYILILTNDNQIKKFYFEEQKIVDYDITYNSYTLNPYLNSNLLIDKTKGIVGIVDKTLKEVFKFPSIIVSQELEIEVLNNVDAIVFNDKTFVVLKEENLTFYEKFMRKLSETEIEFYDIFSFFEEITEIEDFKKKIIENVKKMIHLKNNMLLIQQETRIIILDSEFNNKQIELDDLKEVLVKNNYILIQNKNEFIIYDLELNKIVSYIIDGIICKIEQKNNKLFLITKVKKKLKEYEFIVYKIDNKIEQIIKFRGKLNFKFHILNDNLLIKYSNNSNYYVFDFQGKNIGKFSINDYRLTILNNNIVVYNRDHLKVYDLSKLINYKEENIEKIINLEKKVAYLFKNSLHLINKKTLKKEVYNYDLEIFDISEVSNNIYVSMVTTYDSRSAYYIGKFQIDFINLIIENLEKTNKLIYPKKRTYTQNYMKGYKEKLVLSFSDEILVLNDNLDIIFNLKREFSNFFEEAFLLDEKKLLIFKFVFNYNDVDYIHDFSKNYEILVYDIDTNKELFKYQIEAVFDIYEFSLQEKYLYFIVNIKNKKRPVILDLETFHFVSENDYFYEQNINNIFYQNFQDQQTNEAELIYKTDNFVKYININFINNCDLIDEKMKIFKLDNKFIKLVKFMRKL